MAVARSLLLLSNIFLSVSAVENVQCGPNQICIERPECPAIEKLYSDLAQNEKDPKIINELKSKICNAKEKKFCCDCNCRKKDDNCPAISRLYTDLSKATNKENYDLVLRNIKSKICNKKEQTFCCETLAAPPAPTCNNCVKKNQCPEIENLFDDFGQERDKEKKALLALELKSKLCDAKEETFCCNTFATTTPPPEINYSGDFLPRLEDGTCGKIAASSEFIFGGKDAKIGEFPFMALLRMRDINNFTDSRFNCGGNLINTRYVLTAAHCYIESNPLNLVRLGEYNVVRDGIDCIQDKCLPPVQDFEVTLADFTIHPDFVYDRKRDQPVVYNDIGLIRLPRTAEINVGVRMICLPLSPAGLALEAPAKPVKVVGWGFTNEHSQRYEPIEKHFLVAENIQQKGDMIVVSHKFCKEQWGIYHGDFIEGQICAFNNMKTSVSTCKGDSGGPMYTREKGDTPDGEDNTVSPWTLTGITSFGSSQCKAAGARPAVFTRVSAYIDWIKQQLKP